MCTSTTASEPPTALEPTPDQVHALLEAARYDDMEDLIAILSMGISPNCQDAEGRTALHMAAANGHFLIVDYLIRNGADVNVTNTERNTPLHWACLNSHKEVVRILIQRGASASMLNSHERTPVDEAVSNGELDVLDAINTAVAQVELEDATIS